MDTVKNRVKKIITDQLGVEESKLVETASFTADLGADSLDTVELIMALEEEFKIEVPDVEAGQLLTVGSVISYIESNIKSSN